MNSTPRKFRRIPAVVTAHQVEQGEILDDEHGVYAASPGDWIVTEVPGYDIVVPEEQFERLYELLDHPSLIERQKVSSSNLRSVGYDSENEVLAVEFPGSSVYEYFDVPPEVYNAFMESESKGKFFHRSVKGQYRFAKVR